MLHSYPSQDKKNAQEWRDFSRAQTNVLMGLTAMAVAVTAGIIGLVSGGGEHRYSISPTINPTELAPVALPVFPPTWTPEPTQTDFPKDPTATFVPTQTLIPSFTPYLPANVSNPVTGGAEIVPYEMGGGATVIGYSVAGRPLEVIRFGSGASGRMMVADIHGGNEWNTAALADELIEYLKNHPKAIPVEDSLFILRSLNPDGLARVLGPDGRVNENDVDLNRNWDAGWQSEWDRDGCWDYRQTTAGNYPNSEPETQALATFIINTRLDALISYHSAALGIFPGGLPPDEPSVRLAEAVAAVTDYPYPPVDTGCDYSGGLVDWTVAHGIPSLDLELANHTDTDFDQNLEVLRVLLHFQK